MMRSLLPAISAVVLAFPAFATTIKITDHQLKGLPGHVYDIHIVGEGATRLYSSLSITPDVSSSSDAAVELIEKKYPPREMGRGGFGTWYDLAKEQDYVRCRAESISGRVVDCNIRHHSLWGDLKGPDKRP